MVVVRSVLAILGVVVIAALSACDDSGADAEQGPSASSVAETHGQSAERTARIAECPARVTGDRVRPCILVFRDARLRECGDGGPGGFDVMASGISCDGARHLRVSLGARGFSSFRRPGEAIYRPWLATGTFSDAEAVRPIGWTCWKRWDPTSKVEDGIRNVCWSDRGAIVLFTQA